MPTIQRVLAVKMPVGVTFTQLAAANAHTLALGSDGKVYAWGSNDGGALGDGTLVDQPVPVEVDTPDGMTFSSVAAGGASSFAVSSDGIIYGWGMNSVGQLGDGTRNDRPLPGLVDMPAGVTFDEISFTYGHGFAVGSDGNAYAWGWNEFGMLGQGNTDEVLNPVLAPSIPGVTFTRYFTGLYSSAALDANGLLYIWGGELAGTEDQSLSIQFDPVAVPMPAGVTVLDYASNYLSSYVDGSDGNTYAWGWNGAGQLGDGTITDRAEPTPITLATPTSVAFGGTLGTGFSTSGETWSATTPESVCGPVDVAVSYEQFGRSMPNVVTASGFTYGSVPAITEQPVAGLVPTGGGDFTVNAAATGDDAPTVQWQRVANDDSAWVDIPGAVAETLTVPVTETTLLRAVFTNCLGQAVSDTATVTTEKPEAAPNPDAPKSPDSLDTEGTSVDPNVTAAQHSLATTGVNPLPQLGSALALFGAGGAVYLIGRAKRKQAHGQS